MGINKGAGKGALNYSLDFVGGTATTVDFNENYSLQQLNDIVVPEIETITGSTVQVQTVQNSNEVATSQAATVEEITATLNSITQDAGELSELVHVDDVVQYFESPTVSTLKK